MQRVLEEARGISVSKEVRDIASDAEVAKFGRFRRLGPKITNREVKSREKSLDVK